uniref:Uncharacterized protein n=1 Tax=Timema poppense TaxID=170557 RepID=A0A7R9DF69_TIMPO|nr:unnamed protein product [Timema poppensis]
MIWKNMCLAAVTSDSQILGATTLEVPTALPTGHVGRLPVSVVSSPVPPNLVKCVPTPASLHLVKWCQASCGVRVRYKDDISRATTRPERYPTGASLRSTTLYSSGSQMVARE